MRKKLTARFVETVTTDKSRVEFFDIEEDGLMLRVSNVGTRAWIFRYRRKSDGKRRFITLGRFPELKLEPARIAAAAARLSASQGGDPASGVQARKAAPTFGEIVTEWQLNHAAANRSDRVRADDQSKLNRYVLPSIGAMKAHDVGRRELAAMIATVRTARDGRKGHDKEKARKLSHQPNRVFEMTRAIMRWAHEQGAIPADPTLGMKRPVKKEAPRERALTPSEIAKFWKNVELMPMTPGLRLALKLSLATGQRIGEVVGIAKSELTLDGPAPVWVLPSVRAKNDESSRVPLSHAAVTLILEALALQPEATDERLASPYLFPARAKRDKSHGPIEANAAAVAMFRGRAKLGLENFRVHDLRRTAATCMAEMGINPHSISLVLNHVSASKGTITGKIYIHYSYDKEKREALDAWGARLERIISGKEGENVVAFNSVKAG